jgi:release factor glutamine methyltransferase
MRLAIDPTVLDPRPDTETLIEAALDWAAQGGLRMEKLNVLDIGTGSGALLWALLSELPHAIGTAIDRSSGAIEVAKANAVRHGLAMRCTFTVCDMATDVQAPFDLIVSNPPYIATAEIPSLQPEVRNFDPQIALDGGTDGLDAYRAILRDTRRLLATKGRLILELGHGQEQAVTRLATDAGLLIAGGARKDLGGVARALSIVAP